MPIVEIPPPFRGTTEGESSVEVDGATVLACIEAVGRRYPGFRELVVDDANRVRGWAHVYRNDEALEADGLGATLAPGDAVRILASIGGG